MSGNWGSGDTGAGVGDWPSDLGDAGPGVGDFPLGLGEEGPGAVGLGGEDAESDNGDMAFRFAECCSWLESTV